MKKNSQQKLNPALFFLTSMNNKAVYWQISIFYFFLGRNKQPPSSGLGTASPAFVEARMYAPPNAANKKVLTTTVFHTLCYCHKIGKLRIRQWMYESTTIYFCPLSMIIPASSRPKLCMLYLKSASG